MSELNGTLDLNWTFWPASWPGVLNILMNVPEGRTLFCLITFFCILIITYKRFTIMTWIKLLCEMISSVVLSSSQRVPAGIPLHMLLNFEGIFFSWKSTVEARRIIKHATESWRHLFFIKIYRRSTEDNKACYWILKASFFIKIYGKKHGKI